MSRIENQKKVAKRRAKVLKLIPRSERKAIGARAIADTLGEEIATVRRDINYHWALGKVDYSGETRARVYWRAKAAKAA